MTRCPSGGPGVDQAGPHRIPWQRPLGRSQRGTGFRSSNERSGDIEPTAPLADFNASLTTAQNPALTGQLEVLSAKHPEQLPVLDAVRDSVGAPAHQPHSASATTQQQRKWSRSCRSRNARISDRSPAVQRAADVTDSPRELHPIEASSPGEPQPDSLIAAPQPLDQRILEVATDDSSSDGAWSQESLPSSPTAEESAAVPDTGDMDSASTTAAVAPVPSLTQPLCNGATGQRRHQRKPSAAASPIGPACRHRKRPGAEHVSNAAPLPVVRAPDSPGGQRRDHQADAGTTPARGSEPTLQRTPDVGPDRAIETAITPPLPSAPTPPHVLELQLLPTIGAGAPATTKIRDGATSYALHRQTGHRPPRADSAVPVGSRQMRRRLRRSNAYRSTECDGCRSTEYNGCR